MDFNAADMKAARKQLGYTQTQLGQMLDPPVPWRTIAHWEKGDYKPKSPRREQLIRILDLAGAPEQKPVQTGEVNLPRHELVRGLLAIRSEVDGLLSRV